MVNEKVKRLLIEFNPFWKQQYIIEYKPRAIYPKIQKVVKEKQIISLCGLRRVGKTSILKKLIFDTFLENLPDSVLYFSFDDFSDCELFDIIDSFKEIHGKEPQFLFFDEVQKLSNWAEKIKILYDTGKYKIFVSGSESLFLAKGSKESLAGRIYEFEIKKLSFLEYLAFKGKTELVSKLSLYESELQKELENYVLTAGFPELIEKSDRDLIKQYIKSAVIDKIVFLDMPKIYGIDDPSKLTAILEIVVDNPGLLVDFSSLSGELGISRQTLSKYFDYLESAHLVTKLYNFSTNKITSEKRLKKYYPTFLSPTISFKEDDAYYGKIIETICVLSSEAKFFWRDKYKDEVDIILTSGEKIVPVEIKYRNEPKPMNGLKKFCKKYKCTQAFVVTKNLKKDIKNAIEIKFMRAFAFLLAYSK